MNVKIKLIDETLPMPAYQTKGSVAFDLYSRIDIDLAPFTPTIIPLNVVIKVPKGYVLVLSSRSSLPKKYIMMGNGIGIIDQDFCGDTNEMGFFAVNISKSIVHVERGQRICQGTLLKIGLVEKFVKVKSMGKKDRGSFGSTGDHHKKK